MPLQIPKCDCGESDVQITCLQCEQDFCTKCDEKTHWSARLKQHGRRPYAGVDSGSSQYCSVQGHEKQSLPLFCQTCSKLICGLCLHGEHKMHSSVPLKEAVENATVVLKASILPIQERITKHEKEIKDIREEIKKERRKDKRNKTKNRRRCSKNRRDKKIINSTAN